MTTKSFGSFKLGALERFAAGFHADLRFGPLNILILVVLCMIGLFIHLSLYPFRLPVVFTMVVAAIALAPGNSTPPTPRAVTVAARTRRRLARVMVFSRFLWAEPDRPRR